MTSGRLSRSAMLATLRQVAVLGLPGAMVRDTLSSVIQKLIPNDLVTLMEVDGGGNIIDGWVSNAEILPSFGTYLEHYLDKKEAEAYVPFGTFFRSQANIDLLHKGTGNLLRSEIYNELWKPVDTRYMLRGALREAGRARGGVILTRGHSAKDFTAVEVRLAAEINGYLTHALQAPDPPLTDTSTAEISEGMLLCNSQGTVEYLSAQGRKLLHEAADVPLSPTTLSDRCYSWATPMLIRLINETRSLEARRTGMTPIFTSQNNHGKYVLRAWRMATDNGHGLPALYTISIRRYIPLSLRLLHYPQVQAMPWREKQVCLLLAEGREIGEISQRLGVTRNTANSYIKQLYQRLSINSRHELLTRLQVPF